MKIISWNVAGLRACIDKGFYKYIREAQPDILCIQETKVSYSYADFYLPGYKAYYNCADKPGYSGTLTATKLNHLSAKSGTFDDIHNHEGRLLTVEFDDFYVINCYTPNSQSELIRLPYRLQFEEALRNHCSAFMKIKPIILCGDLNVSYKWEDLARPETNQFSAGFSKEEREEFGKLLGIGLTDAYRYLYPDEVGAYSYWSYRTKARERNVGWRLDYFMIDNRIANRIVDVKMRKDILGSDHCPIELELF